MFKNGTVLSIDALDDASRYPSAGPGCRWPHLSCDKPPGNPFHEPEAYALYAQIASLARITDHISFAYLCSVEISSR